MSVFHVGKVFLLKMTLSTIWNNQGTGTLYSSRWIYPMKSKRAHAKEMQVAEAATFIHEIVVHEDIR